MGAMKCLVTMLRRLSELVEPEGLDHIDATKPQTEVSHTSTQHYAPYPPSKRDSPPNPPLVQQSHTNNHYLLRDLSLGFSGPLPAARGHPKSTPGQGVDSGGFIH